MFILYGRKMIWIGAITLGLLSSSTVAFAENMMKVEPVKVTATRTEKFLSDVPNSVSVISAEEIAKSPGKTVSELLQSIPGILLEMNSDPTVDRVRIRGESAQRTLYLIDGQKISNQNSVDGVMMSVDPSIIERIEVIRGAASVLYGAEAIGGVVNIITKKGGKKPIQGELTSSYLSANSGFRESIGLFGSLNGFNYRVSGAYNNLDDLRTYDGTEPHSNVVSKNGTGFLSYDFNDSWTAGMGVETWSQDRENENHNNKRPVEPEDWSKYDEGRTKVNGFVEGKNITDYFSRLRADIFYQDNTSERHGYEKNTNATRSTTDDSTDTLGVSLQTDWLLGESTFLIAGYDFLQDTLDANTNTYDTLTNLISNKNYRKGEQNTHAGYLMLEHALPADLTLSYGMRYTYVDSKMTRSEDVSAAGVTTPKGTLGDANESKPVFTAGLVWQGIDDLALRASWTQGFRPSTIFEKYVDAGMNPAFMIAGNPDLKSETSENFEVGARYDNGKVSADVGIFYSTMKDLIEWDTVNKPAGYYAQYDNVEDAKKWGIEGLVDYTFDNGLRPYVSATFLRRKLDESYNDQIPTLTGRTGVAFYRSYDDGLWALNADVYVQAQNTTEYDDDALNVPGYGTFNIAFGIEWGEEHKFFAQAEILNVFDKRYLTKSLNSFYEPGTNANLVFGYRF